MFRVKKVPMFRDFAPKMDPCLGILLQKTGFFLKVFWARYASPENFLKMDP